MTAGETTAARVFAAVAALPFGWYDASLLRAGIRFHTIDELWFCMFGTVAVIGSCLASFAVWGHRPSAQRVLRWTCIGSGVVGGGGFAAGFLGPMFLSTSNQGPLLGIFITGPIGFMVGAALGAIYGVLRERTEQERQSA